MWIDGARPRIHPDAQKELDTIIRLIGGEKLQQPIPQLNSGDDEFMRLNRERTTKRPGKSAATLLPNHPLSKWGEIAVLLNALETGHKCFSKVQALLSTGHDLEQLHGELLSPLPLTGTWTWRVCGKCGVHTIEGECSPVWLGTRSPANRPPSRILHPPAKSLPWRLRRKGRLRSQRAPPPPQRLPTCVARLCAPPELDECPF